MKFVLVLAVFTSVLSLNPFLRISEAQISPTVTCEGKNNTVSPKIINVVSNPYCCGLSPDRKACLENKVAALKDLRDFIKPYYDDIIYTSCDNNSGGPSIEMEWTLPPNASVDQWVKLVETMVGLIQQGDTRIASGINALQQLCQ